MTDISREAVEQMRKGLMFRHRSDCKTIGVDFKECTSAVLDAAYMLAALRAALDAAEARERQAVEWADAREACIKAASDFVSAEELRYHIDRLSKAEWALFSAIRTGAKPACTVHAPGCPGTGSHCRTEAKQ